MPNAAKSAIIVTGPTSGFGLRAALELAAHAPLILVGRSAAKLAEVKALVERGGGEATAVVCDLSDPDSVKRAAAEIVALGRPIAGLLNNAGVQDTKARVTPRGWDLSFATNHLGPFAFTEALIPHLPDGAEVLFVVSAVEDPERVPAKRAGFRGGRYISAEASARGEWLQPGSARPGFDAYATSKQAGLAAALALARETPRLRINAVEPGLALETNLGDRPVGPAAKAAISVLVRLLMPVFSFLTTPQKAGRVLSELMLDPKVGTGVYYDQDGRPMPGSAQVRDPVFQDRVLAETRAFLARAG